LTKELISIEVAYALPDWQKIQSIQVARGTTALEAAKQSGIQSHFPNLDLDSSAMGIFGNELGSRGLSAPDEYLVRQGDRIEIYRPLTADPKEVRRQRAEEAKKKRAETAAAAAADSDLENTDRS
jgi:putative ubiquitin-RnfH superfamily antitoxin RatB of RatAB toxin-antitoxin module